MIELRSAAQFVRHLPVVEKADWIWNAVRKPYHCLLDLQWHGTTVMVGGVATVRLPGKFTGSAWEKFEPEAVSKFVDWVRRHPGGLVLDIGSSLGIYCAIALFADDSVEAVAFDSDIASLAAAKQLCRYATGERLRIVHGFIAAESNDWGTLDGAVATTEAIVGRKSAHGQTRYICLGDPQSAAIPCRRLDNLVSPDGLEGRPMLIKCDVEGAELLVLAGAEHLLRRCHPSLLISIHPPVLRSYGHSKNKITGYLEDLGYKISCLAIDHEEHWWCHFHN